MGNDRLHTGIMKLAMQKSASRDTGAHYLFKSRDFFFFFFFWGGGGGGGGVWLFSNKTQISHVITSVAPNGIQLLAHAPTSPPL